MKAMPISILDDIENDPDLVVGKKFNGYSERLVVSDGVIRMFNRSGSEQTANVPHITSVLAPGLDLVLVGEGVAPSERVEDAKSIFGSGPKHSARWQMSHGRARLVAVDITRYQGENLTRVPFGERLEALGSAIMRLEALGVEELHQEVLFGKDKKQFFDYVVGLGGEGVVVKKLTGFMNDWFKVKKVKSWNAVITGFTAGKGKYSGVIGAIYYGFYDNNGHLCTTGKCSGMTDSERAMFASAAGSFIGRVIEIKGQELGNRGGIIFPRFIRFRDDILPTDCLLPIE